MKWVSQKHITLQLELDSETGATKVRVESEGSCHEPPPYAGPHHALEDLKSWGRFEALMAAKRLVADAEAAMSHSKGTPQ